MSLIMKIPLLLFKTQDAAQSLADNLNEDAKKDKTGEFYFPHAFSKDWRVKIVNAEDNSVEYGFV